VTNAAGLTHGGFYKQFKSKEELTVEACDRALADSAEVWAQAVKRGDADPFAELIRSYPCSINRDDSGEFCPSNVIERRTNECPPPKAADQSRHIGNVRLSPSKAARAR
jgi:AcrR family transcriptional regulator